MSGMRSGPGREVMPIPERWRPIGGDVSSLDAEMLKRIEQIGFNGTRCWCVQIFAPLFKKADQFYEYLSAADCKHILIDRHNLEIIGGDNVYGRRQQHKES